MLPKFHNSGLLSFNLCRISNNISSIVHAEEFEETIKNSLQQNKAVYHKSCYDNHNETKLSRALNRKKRKKEVDDQEKTKKVTVRSFGSSSIALGSHVCIFCNEIDNEQNLIAAGTLHAKTLKVKQKHVDDFTKNLREMALFLNDSNLLPKISTGDVATNEVFYHKKCYINYRNKHRSAVRGANKSSISLKEQEIDYAKTVCFNKIMNYVYEKGQEQENVSFQVSDLEDLYYDQLSINGIEYSKHTSRFANKLVSNIPDLEIRTINNKLSVFFKDSLDVLSEALEPDSYLRSINKVVKPLRKIMSEWKNEFNGTFESDCQEKSVPVQLLTLISQLLDGNNLSDKRYSQGTLTCAQILMYNFKKVYHKQRRETPIVLYLS